MVAPSLRSVLGLAAAVGASGRLGAAAARAGVPALTLALGCGAVVGPQGLGWLLPTPLLAEVQRICLAILIFAAGGELRPNQLKAHLKVVRARRTTRWRGEELEKGGGGVVLVSGFSDRRGPPARPLAPSLTLSPSLSLLFLSCFTD